MVELVHPVGQPPTCDGGGDDDAGDVDDDDDDADEGTHLVLGKQWGDNRILIDHDDDDYDYHDDYGQF